MAMISPDFLSPSAAPSLSNLFADYQLLGARCWETDSTIRPSFEQVLEELQRMRARILGPGMGVMGSVPGATQLGAGAGRSSGVPAGMSATSGGFRGGAGLGGGSVAPNMFCPQPAVVVPGAGPRAWPSVEPAPLGGLGAGRGSGGAAEVSLDATITHFPDIPLDMLASQEIGTDTGSSDLTSSVGGGMLSPRSTRGSFMQRRSGTPPLRGDSSSVGGAEDSGLASSRPSGLPSRGGASGRQRVSLELRMLAVGPLPPGLPAPTQSGPLRVAGSDPPSTPLAPATAEAAAEAAAVRGVISSGGGAVGAAPAAAAPFSSSAPAPVSESAVAAASLPREELLREWAGRLAASQLEAAAQAQEGAHEEGDSASDAHTWPRTSGTMHAPATPPQLNSTGFAARHDMGADI